LAVTVIVAFPVALELFAGISWAPLIDAVYFVLVAALDTPTSVAAETVATHRPNATRVRDMRLLLIGIPSTQEYAA
jgi:hypothetical protein